MILRKFTNLYPRTLWIAIVNSGRDIDLLTKKFTFYASTPGMRDIVEHPDRSMLNAFNGEAIAECRPVMFNTDCALGIICIIYVPEEIDTSIVAHESVHIADYYFEITGMRGEDFSEGGNESYAYLVGWCAGCFTKVMEEYAKTK